MSSTVCSVTRRIEAAHCAKHIDFNMVGVKVRSDRASCTSYCSADIGSYPFWGKPGELPTKAAELTNPELSPDSKFRS